MELHSVIGTLLDHPELWLVYPRRIFGDNWEPDLGPIVKACWRILDAGEIPSRRRLAAEFDSLPPGAELGAVVAELDDWFGEEANGIGREHVLAACKLLPAWFVPRMMVCDPQSPYRAFAFLLASGHTLVIARIVDVRQASNGSLWIDVELAGPLEEDDRVEQPVAGRGFASVAASDIVVAYELGLRGVD